MKKFDSIPKRVFDVSYIIDTMKKFDSIPKRMLNVSNLYAFF